VGSKFEKRHVLSMSVVDLLLLGLTARRNSLFFSETSRVTHQGHYIDFQMTLEHRGNFLISLDILGGIVRKG